MVGGNAMRTWVAFFLLSITVFRSFAASYSSDYTRANAIIAKALNEVVFNEQYSDSQGNDVLGELKLEADYSLPDFKTLIVKAGLASSPWAVGEPSSLVIRWGAKTDPAPLLPSAQSVGKITIELNTKTIPFLTLFAAKIRDKETLFCQERIPFSDNLEELRKAWCDSVAQLAETTNFEEFAASLQKSAEEWRAITEKTYRADTSNVVAAYLRHFFRGLSRGVSKRSNNAFSVNIPQTLILEQGVAKLANVNLSLSESLATMTIAIESTERFHEEFLEDAFNVPGFFDLLSAQPFTASAQTALNKVSNGFTGAVGFFQRAFPF
jgi:hypothetical protein